MRSLNTGFDEMSSLVGDFEFDMFAVTETWLHPDTPSSSCMIPGYVMVRADRRDGRGGGVALYVKEGISFEQRATSQDVDPGLDCISVVVKLKGTRLGLCVVYRPPHLRYTSLAPLFHSLFVDLAMEVKSVICLGDTNIDLLSKNACDEKYLRRLLNQNNAVQLVKEPTRITNHSATLLDHIFVDRSAEVERIGVIDAPSLRNHRGNSITDHKLIHCNIKCQKDKIGPQYISYRDFSKFDAVEATEKLAEIDWDHVHSMQDVNEIEKYVTSGIRRVFDELAPVVCKKVTKKKSSLEE